MIDGQRLALAIRVQGMRVALCQLGQSAESLPHVRLVRVEGVQLGGRDYAVGVGRGLVEALDMASVWKMGVETLTGGIHEIGT
jgi:hypothetical protein